MYVCMYYYYYSDKVIKYVCNNHVMNGLPTRPNNPEKNIQTEYNKVTIVRINGFHEHDFEIFKYLLQSNH